MTQFDWEVKIIERYGNDVEFDLQPPGGVLSNNKETPMATHVVATKDSIVVGIFDFGTNRGSVYGNVIVRDSCVRTKRIIAENARNSQFTLTDIQGKEVFVSEHNNGIVNGIEAPYALVRFERAARGSGIYGQPIEVRLEDLELINQTMFSPPILLTNIEVADTIKAFLHQFEFKDEIAHVRTLVQEPGGYEYVTSVPIQHAFARRFTDVKRRKEWKLMTDWYFQSTEQIGRREFDSNWACKVLMGRDMQDIALNPMYNFNDIEQLVRRSVDIVPTEQYPHLPEYSEYRMIFSFPGT